MQQITAQQQAALDLSTRFGTDGTSNYIGLIDAIVQELGITLAAAIDPEQTSRLFSLRDTLSMDQLSEMIDLYLNHQMGLKDDLEAARTQIHKIFGNMFAKHKSNLQIPGYCLFYEEKETL